MSADPHFRVVEDANVRMVDETNHEIEARICSYGVGPDTYQTTWHQGWAADSLRAAQNGEHTVPVVFGHDERNMTNIIGSVVGHHDEADGLYVRMRLANFDEVPAARTAYSLLRDGHLRTWSFKFRDGETQPDPEHRGAMQFTRARLVHVSPVVDASIPGTGTVAIRDANDARADKADGDGAAGEILIPVRPDLSGFREALQAGVRDALAGVRDLVIRVADDGTVTTGSDAPLGVSGDAPDDDYDRDATIGAIDGAIDAALAYAANLDLPSLPAEVGLIVQLLTAADVAVDELMEGEGIPDYDPGDDAPGSSDGARSPKPYGNVAYADPKNGKYPIDTAEHCKAAWAYIHQAKNQAGYSGQELADIESRIAAAAKKFGITLDAKRDARPAAADPAVAGERGAVDDVDVALALSRLGRR